MKSKKWKHRLMQSLTPDMLVLILDGIYVGYSGPDERLDPQVANWDHETCQIGTQHPFWSWFDDHIPLQFGLTTEWNGTNETSFSTS